MIIVSEIRLKIEMEKGIFLFRSIDDMLWFLLLFFFFIDIRNILWGGEKWIKIVVKLIVIVRSVWLLYFFILKIIRMCIVLNS